MRAFEVASSGTAFVRSFMKIVHRIPNLNGTVIHPSTYLDIKQRRPCLKNSVNGEHNNLRFRHKD